MNWGKRPISVQVWVIKNVSIFLHSTEFDHVKFSVLLSFSSECSLRLFLTFLSIIFFWKKFFWFDYTTKLTRNICYMMIELNIGSFDGSLLAMNSCREPRLSHLISVKQRERNGAKLIKTDKMWKVIFVNRACKERSIDLIIITLSLLSLWNIPTMHFYNGIPRTIPTKSFTLTVSMAGNSEITLCRILFNVLFYVPHYFLCLLVNK